MLNQDLNPIDNVEVILKSNNWVFDRMNDEELYVQITGAEAEYNLYFMWDESLNALQLCCQYETEIPQDHTLQAMRTIMGLNESLWMGHFDLPTQSQKPCFRYTSVISDATAAKANHIGNLVDIALAQCERFYPVIKMLAHGTEMNQGDLTLAMMDTQGRS